MAEGLAAKEQRHLPLGQAFFRCCFPSDTLITLHDNTTMAAGEAQYVAEVRTSRNANRRPKVWL